MNNILITMKHPFPCNPIYCKLMGNLLAGMLLSQIVNIYLHFDQSTDLPGFDFDHEGVSLSLGITYELGSSITLLEDKKIIYIKDNLFHLDKSVFRDLANV